MLSFYPDMEHWNKMNDHQGVTATMPMTEYLQLKALKALAEELTHAEKTPVAHRFDALSMVNPRSDAGYTYKFTKFESLKDVCNAARKALGYQELPT